MTNMQTNRRHAVSYLRLKQRASRRFLNRNEIYFKTVAATTLTVVSLAFGRQQIKIAERQSETAQKQNALSDKQLAFVDLQSRIAEAQAMPSFEIKISQLLNSVSGKADNNVLTIENHGGPVREFYARAIYFIEITAGKKRIPIPKSVHLRIPISDYYTANAVTAATKGHLATIFGNDNNLKFITFSRALSASADGQNWLYANTEERTFLRIQYNDILNRPHEEYYEVAPVSGSRIISNEVGRAAFDDAAPQKRVSFHDLTIEKASRDLAALMKAQPR